MVFYPLKEVVPLVRPFLELGEKQAVGGKVDEFAVEVLAQDVLEISIDVDFIGYVEVELYYFVLFPHHHRVEIKSGQLVLPWLQLLNLPFDYFCNCQTLIKAKYCFFLGYEGFDQS